jgi:flagellar basal-body rod modification protein FlgD
MIDAIGALGTTSDSVPSSAGISQDDFLRILLTQLRFQDPLKPVDNKDFIAQLAQFSALEINRQQSEKVDSLLSIQAATQGITLIGRSVEVGSASGSAVGTVTAITFNGGDARLTVRTSTSTLVDVRPSDVRLVR